MQHATCNKAFNGLNHQKYQKLIKVVENNRGRLSHASIHGNSIGLNAIITCIRNNKV